MFRSSRIAPVIAATAFACSVHAVGPDLDTSAIESITGLKGGYNKTENVFKISKPRNDIKVNVDRWTLPPFMGITSWAAFTPAGSATSPAECVARTLIPPVAELTAMISAELG